MATDRTGYIRALVLPAAIQSLCFLPPISQAARRRHCTMPMQDKTYVHTGKTRQTDRDHDYCKSILPRRELLARDVSRDWYDACRNLSYLSRIAPSLILLWVMHVTRPNNCLFDGFAASRHPQVFSLPWNTISHSLTLFRYLSRFATLQINVFALISTKRKHGRYRWPNMDATI